MASNSIVLKGTTYNGVSSLEVPKSGGGTALFTDVSDTTAAAADVASGKYFYDALGAYTAGTASGGGGGQYAWLGDDAEKIGTVYTNTVNLKDDTTYDSWTASTTETTLIPESATADYTLNADFVNYDYCLVHKGYIQPVYNTGTPETYRTHRVVQYYVYYIYGYPNTSTTSNVQTDTAGNAVNTAFTNAAYQYYYNSSGAIVSRIATACGPCYTSVPSVTVTFSSGTVKYKQPSFLAKCDASRFTTERKGQVDSANTNYYLTVDVYRVPHGKGIASHWVSQACADLNA